MCFLGCACVKDNIVCFFLPNLCTVNMHVRVWKCFFNQHYKRSFIDTLLTTPLADDLQGISSGVPASQDNQPTRHTVIHYACSLLTSKPLLIRVPFSSEFPYCTLMANHYHEVISSSKLRVTCCVDACGTPPTWQVMKQNGHAGNPLTLQNALVDAQLHVPVNPREVSWVRLQLQRLHEPWTKVMHCKIRLHLWTQQHCARTSLGQFSTTRTTRRPQGQLGDHKDNQVTIGQLGDHRDN